jgi:hypothetical protein
MKKNTIILIMLFLVSGCSLILNIPTYYCYVDSYTKNKDFDKNYILHNNITDDKSDEYLTNEFEHYLNKILESKGFRLNSEYKTGMTVIHYNYGLKVDIEDVKKIKPIIGVKGTTTETSGKEKYYPQDTRYSVNSTTKVDRGIVGWDTYNSSKQIFKKGIVLEAVSYDADNKIRNKYWKTTVYTESGGNDLRKMIPIMLESIKHYININTNGTKKLIIERYKDRIKVKE